MSQKRVVSHVYTHRKRNNLTQRELAFLLGHRSPGRVSRHERGITVPSFAAALGYQAIFGTSVPELFPALHDDIARNVAARFGDLESVLGEKSLNDPDAEVTARKLQFIAERKRCLNIVTP
jgi:transcriptional regulator with XRE-family HTH domain